MAPKNVRSSMAQQMKKVQLSDKLAEWTRRERQTGLNWERVSATSLRCALHTLLHGGAAIMFSAAAGGSGVCLTIFDDGDRIKEYTMNAEELNLLLDGITNAYGLGGEDIRVAMKPGAE